MIDPSATKSKNTKGTGNKGQEYEIMLPALFCLKFFQDPTIRSFTIQTNMCEFGIFDDLIVNLQTETGPQNYAFQFKHKEKKNEHFRPEYVENENHDFGIITFGKCYTNIEVRNDYHFILYTNAYTNDKHLHKMKRFEMSRQHLCPGMSYFYNPSSESTTHEIYKFGLKEKECIIDPTFFDKFSFYAYQKNMGDTENLVNQVFQEVFPTINKFIVTEYIHIFRHLNMQQLSEKQLTKETLAIRIFDMIISPYLLVPSTKHPTFMILEKIFKIFDFTIIGSTDENLIKKFGTDSYFSDDDDVLCIAKKFTFVKKHVRFSNTQLGAQMKHKISCYSKGKPIFLKHANRSVINALIKLRKPQDNLHVVLFECDINPQDLQQFYVFSSLHDLSIRNNDLFKEITQLLKIDLSGAEYNFADLFGDDDESAKLVKVEDVFRMLEGSYRFRINVETLVNPYISRVVTTTLLDVHTIDDIYNDLLVVSHGGNFKTIQRLRKTTEKKFLTVDEYLQTETQKTNPANLVLYKRDVSQNDLEEIKNFTQNNVHHFTVFDNTHLEWKSTNGSIKEMKEHVFVSKPIVKEATMHDRFQNRINVIAALPGIGKSELLKRLHLTCPAHLLPIKVNLKEHNNFFRTKHTASETCNYFLNFSDDELLLNRLKQVFARKKKVVFFFDELDKLYHENVSSALDHLQLLLDYGFKIWVTTTPILAEAFESYFNVFSMRIGSFSDEEQKEYVQKRLPRRSLNEEVFKNVKANLENRDILEVPLLLYIITEILQDNSQQIKANMFVWTKMFPYFITKRYHDYFFKNQCTHWDYLQDVISDSKRFRMRQYQIAGLKSCLDRSYFNLLNLKIDDAFVEDVQSKGDFLGILCQISRDNAFFHHNFFAEYFAASWLRDNCLHARQLLKDILFKEEYARIRLMFNMILVEDMPAHVAVLNRSIAQLRNYKHQIFDLDKGGRNALHLACTHGTSPSILNDISKEVYPETIRAYRKIDEDYRGILEIVLAEGDLLQNDYLLQWNPLQFACKTFSLLPLQVILEKRNEYCEKVFELDIFTKHKWTILYYSAVLSYHKIFQRMLSSSSMLKNSIEFLLFLAVKWNSWKIVKILLENDVEIETKTKYGKTPLHFACSLGHVEVVILLLTKNANLNAVDNIQRTPFHLAAANAHLNVIKKLLEEDALQINACDKFGRTALHISIKTGDPKLVEFLLDYTLEIDKPSFVGWTALHFAVDQDNSEIVKLLLYRNANFQIEDAYGFKPLQLAAKNGSVEILKILLDKTNYAQELTNDERTCLHLAAESGQVQACQFLMKHIDVGARDKRGRSALHWAVIENHQEVVQILANEMKDFSIVDNNGSNCLHQAAALGNLNIFKCLLRKMKAYVNSVTHNGCTALHWAAIGGHNDVVTLLLNEGANINARDKNGRTALQYAELEGHSYTVGLLSQKVSVV